MKGKTHGAHCLRGTQLQGQQNFSAGPALRGQGSGIDVYSFHHIYGPAAVPLLQDGSARRLYVAT